MPGIPAKPSKHTVRNLPTIRTGLYCGDCAEGMRALPDASVDFVVADPPYGIGNPKDVYNRDDSNVWGGYQEAPCDPDGYLAFSRSWLREACRVLKPGGGLIVFSGWTFNYLVKWALHEIDGMEEINNLIWKYSFGVWTTRKFVSSHYDVFYWAKKGAKRTFNVECRYKKFERSADDGGSLIYRDLEDVWHIKRRYRKGKMKNQNELPEEIVEKVLDYLTNPGDLVLDPFLGGFTTARVARRMGRRCIGFEVNPVGFAEKADRVLAICPLENV